jgi:hypothetical protein
MIGDHSTNKPVHSALEGINDLAEGFVVLLPKLSDENRFCGGIESVLMSQMGYSLKKRHQLALTHILGESSPDFTRIKKSEPQSEVRF